MMRRDDFEFIAALLKQRSGLVLARDKEYLVESRLQPVARMSGFAGVHELCGRLRAQPQEALLVAVTEAMTTNESSFFRDLRPYESLRRLVLPMMAGQSQLRIWSAACSTGQEPYSIAMCLKEDEAALPPWRCEIIASDLAHRVLTRARSGIYSQFEVQRGLPIQLLLKYFEGLPEMSWQVKDSLRGMVDFRAQNLLDDFSPLGVFDIIFCRNVLIYFDEPMRAEIITRMAQSLRQGGVLVLGSTETLLDPQRFYAPLEGFRGGYVRS